MKEEDEDGGIAVDFDQIAHETQFYTSCLEDRGDGDGNVSRADSAVCLNTPRDPPPALFQKFNSSRRDHFVRTFRENDVKRCSAYRREMQSQRNGIDSYLLNQQKLAVHLIDFADLPLKKNMQRRIWTDRVNAPLYSMSESGLEVNPDYYFPMESPYATIQKSFLRSLADNLCKNHRKLCKLTEFVENCGERSQLMLPMLISVFCDWAKEFLSDYSKKLDELRSERLVDPLQALARLNLLAEDVEVVVAIIGEDAERHVWLWEDIEKSWNRVFILTHQEAIVKKRQVVAKLQTKWIRALLSTMDHIFEMGRVPPEAAHFVLHNDVKPDSELLLCRNIHDIGSLLWEEQLIETILEAVKCRVRIGVIEFPNRTFTNAFYSLLPDGKLPIGEIIPFDEFRSLFLETSTHLKSKFADELLAELHKDNRFVNLWVDLEACDKIRQLIRNVVIGSIAQQYATTVFRSDSNVTNYSDAFWLASRGRMSKENMMLFSWIATSSEFSCKLDHLLSTFIRPELIDVMNKCMRFSHSAYRTRELLVTMANDKDLMCRMKCLQSSLDVSRTAQGMKEAENMNRALRTKLRFFVFTLEQIVSHFREMFADKVRYVFKTKRNEIINATSLNEVETAVAEGHRQLNDLVVRTGVRRMVHETMDMLLSMTDEIRLRSVSNTLDFDYLNRCQEVVRKNLVDLVALHASMGNDKDSIFFHLSVRLGKLNNVATAHNILKEGADDVLHLYQNCNISSDADRKKFKEHLMSNVMEMMELETEMKLIEDTYEKLSELPDDPEVELPTDAQLLKDWTEKEKELKRKKGGDRKHFKEVIRMIRDDETAKRDDEDDEMEVMQVQHSRKDPISKKDIVNPVINPDCKHVYDRDSIHEFAGKKKVIDCAMQGCSHKIQISKLKDYPDFWKNIKQQQ